MKNAWRKIRATRSFLVAATLAAILASAFLLFIAVLRFYDEWLEWNDPFWIVPIALWCVIIAGMLRWRKRAALVVACVSPLFISVVPIRAFAHGCLDYRDGSAHILGAGLYGPEGFNLDRQLRVPHSTIGCCVDGLTDLHVSAYNAGVKMCLRKFGPMRGAYLGEYPDQRSAVKYMETGTTQTTLSELTTTPIVLRGKTIFAPEAVRYAIKRHEERLRSNAPVHLKTLNDECLLVRFEFSNDTTDVLLFDPKTWSRIAEYIEVTDRKPPANE